MNTRKLALTARASALALVVGLPAGQAIAADADTGVEVQELVVTARKRDEALIDVPFSVAAQSEAVMRNRGITNVEELSRTVASFTVQNLGPGQSQVAIRGISAGQIVRDQPGVKEQVGVYLDESVISLSPCPPSPRPRRSRNWWSPRASATRRSSRCRSRSTPRASSRCATAA